MLRQLLCQSLLENSHSLIWSLRDLEKLGGGFILRRGEGYCSRNHSRKIIVVMYIRLHHHVLNFMHVL